MGEVLSKNARDIDSGNAGVGRIKLILAVAPPSQGTKVNRGTK